MLKTRRQLSMETLESRDVPSVSAIAANFNPVPIQGGTTVWFSSEAKVAGLPTDAVTTLHVTAQTVSFTARGTAYTVPVPDSTITFDPALRSSKSSALFAGRAWSVGVPSSPRGEVFLSGAAFRTPAGGLPGGIKNVTWTGTFTADRPGLTVKWEWSAAVYKKFAADLSDLDVTPTDRSGGWHWNRDDAGTPENFARHNVPGARGHGFGDDTGADSRRVRVAPTFTPAATGASLSGRVYLDVNENNERDADDTPFAGLTMTLSGVDADGTPVAATTVTGDDGSYTFTGLPAGTYSILVETPVGHTNGAVAIGSLGAVNTGPDFIEGIALDTEGGGTGYDFGLVGAQSQ